MASSQAESDSEEDFHDAITGIASPTLADSRALQTGLPEPKAHDSTTARSEANDRTVSLMVRAVQAVEVVDDEAAEDLPPPEHPLNTMQGPFEESILESALDVKRPTPAYTNAEARRQKLLNSHRFDESWTTRWRQRPDAKYHPLLKLVAQITFGMHLLQQNQAKSDQEVVKILQTHVDEVDNFLERTTEDFELAIKDVEERIQFLQLPMQHMKVFDVMLDDKQFRTQLLDGNDKIERIIDRTARSMNAALLDVQKGRQSTRELGKYLNNVQHMWPSDRADLEAIYVAMRGNEEGWRKCYRDLQTQGNNLGNKLIELGTVVGEMSKMAAIASRRNAQPNRPKSSGNSSVASPTALRSRYNIDAQNPYVSTPTKDKPLPRAPGMNGTPRQQPPRPASFHQRFERPRASVPSSPLRNATVGVDGDTVPHGSQGGTDRADAKSSDRRTSVALSSHPPEGRRPRSAGNDANGPARRPKIANGAVSSPDLTAGVSKNTALSRAQSAADPRKPPISNNDGFLQSKRDVIERSSFARRWSIRKKHPGPKPEDYSDEPARPVTNANTARTKPQKTKPTPTSPKQGSAGTDQAKAGSAQTLPHVEVSPPSESKSRTGSIRFGRSNLMQGLSVPSSKPESVHTGSESVSLASSIKRRTLNLKGIFSKRPDKIA